MRPHPREGKSAAGIACVEVEAEDITERSLCGGSSLRPKAATCWPVLLGLLHAQMADLVTTGIGLVRRGYVEENLILPELVGLESRRRRGG